MKSEKLKVMKKRSIDEVLDEVHMLIDTHLFDEFSKANSSLFPAKVLAILDRFV